MPYLASRTNQCTGDLGKMLRTHEARMGRMHAAERHDPRCFKCYNELVLSAAGWVSQLPETIEAFFLQPGMEPAAVNRAWATRAAFLHAYKLDEHAKPLVLYDLTSVRPFQLL